MITESMGSPNHIWCHFNLDSLHNLLVDTIVTFTIRTMLNILYSRQMVHFDTVYAIELYVYTILFCLMHCSFVL